MRLFVGLPLPRWVRDELAGALGPHRAAWPGLRWPDPETWHVTLAFLGEVPEEVRPDLETRLARAASRHAPMTLSLVGAGAFPSARRARVFWTGLYGPRLRLVRLAGSLGAGAERAGAVQTDRRPLRPHLTLARSRTDVDLSRLVEDFGPFAGSSWEAGEVHLVRSHLGAVVRYETVATYPLAARAPGGQS
ncbi:2'-5' RNA ligase [Streptosporangium album]|uniref:RNA 2',3'-cyclic phosphodiesterase n=1 Tax=Streptosporangium album TaxID=47479 RepID=A0A7W7W868_9ACTN|nr:RNA 2',3'-cyclic phosphodiesterase [Streptosporangium album]MBB4938007.1 2'-5' RNA ligase [Streptosporangium album]